MTSERRQPDTSPDAAPQPTPASASLAVEELRPGLFLEQFRIVGPLGRGGMGVVYEAEDTLLRRRVALKVLPPAVRAEDSYLQRLLREAQAVACLKHPNVVGIHHVGRWQGSYYLVLELMHGGSLRARAGAAGMPWPEATRAVADACRGLQAAHAAGLIHRDIKPGNLMCDEAGLVRLADFGLVRGGDLTASTGERLAGTPDFMSPEQCRGEPADERSDLYALGATYFALLTGRPPYPGDTPMQVMFAHCSNPVPDPRAHKPDLPEACATVVRKAMAKQPADRYQSADDLLQDLPGFGGPQVSAVKATPRTSQPPLWSRRSALAALASGAVFTAGLGVVLAVMRGCRGPGGNVAATPTETGPDEPFNSDIPPGGHVIRLGGKVRAVAFSLDGQLFAAGRADQPGGAIVWERATGKVVEHRWREQEVLCLAIVRLGPKGFNLLRGGTDGLSVWPDRRGNEGPFVNGGDSYSTVKTVAVSGDGKRLAAGFSSGRSRGIIDEWEQPGGASTRRFGDQLDWPAVHQLTYSSDGTLAAAFENGEIKVWLPKQTTPIPAGIEPPDGKPAALAFAPNRPVLAIAEGGKVRYWTCAKGVPLGEPFQVTSPVNAITFAPDGKHLAVGEAGGDVTLWDVASRRVVHTFRGHQGEVLGMAISPNGETLATGGEDGTARLWNIQQVLAAKV